MATILDSKLLTAEEFGRLPDDSRLMELVRGRVVELNRPFTTHGYLAYRAAMLLGQFVDQHRLGRVVVGDAGVITERDPDTVRGPDVAFYSFQRIPQGPMPEEYWPASPELVFEIRSKSDRWKDVLQKVAEYLNANVQTVVVVDSVSKRVHLYSADEEATILNTADRLAFPNILPGFEVLIEKLFE